MNDKQLINSFLERGYVITDPVKFYHAVRTSSMESLLSELEESEKSAPVRYLYTSFESDVREYLNGLRSAVNNNYRIANAPLYYTYEDFIEDIRQFADKYMITRAADEQRVDINVRISAAREELDRLNAELTEANNELTTINQRRGALNRELRDLSNNTEISNADKTSRTFEIMSELERLNSEVIDKRRIVRERRDLSEQKTEEIRNLQVEYNNVKEVETPEITIDMRDEFISDLNNLEANALRITKNEDDIRTIRQLTGKFRSGMYIALADKQAANSKLKEIYDRFGITKTDTPVVNKEPIPEVQEEPKEEVKNETPNPEPENKDKGKKIVFLGSYSEIPIATSDYDKLVEGQEYTIKDSDEVSYRLEEVEGVSFSKKAFVEPSMWSTIVALVPKNIDPPKAEVHEEPKEEPIAEEGKLKAGDKMVFHSEDKSFIYSLYTVVDNFKEGEEIEIESVLSNGYKIKGHDAIIKREDMVTLEEWKKMQKSEPVEEKPAEKPVEEPKVESEEFVLDLSTMNPFEGIAILLEGYKSGQIVDVVKQADGKYRIKGTELDIDPKYLVTAEEWNKVHPEFKAERAAEKPTKEPKEEPKEEPKSEEMVAVNYEHGIYKKGAEVVFRPVATLTEDERDYYYEVFIKKGLKEGKSYKIKEVYKDGSIELEGFDVIFPPMGFMSKKEFEDLPEMLCAVKVFDEVEPELEGPKPNINDKDEFVVYNGEDTEKLVNGRRYILDYSFGNIARLKDMETGETITITDFNEDDFELASNVKYDPVDRHIDTFGRKLPEVVMVERIERLNKISNTMATIGVLGIAAGIFSIPVVGAVAVPVIAASAVSATAAIVPQSKMAHSHVANKIYNKVKKLLGEYRERLEGNYDLDEDDLYKLKMASDDLEQSLQNIRTEADERKIFLNK